MPLVINSLRGGHTSLAGQPLKNIKDLVKRPIQFGDAIFVVLRISKLRANLWMTLAIMCALSRAVSLVVCARIDWEWLDSIHSLLLVDHLTSSTSWHDVVIVLFMSFFCRWWLQCCITETRSTLTYNTLGKIYTTFRHALVEQSSKKRVLWLWSIKDMIIMFDD